MPASTMDRTRPEADVVARLHARRLHVHRLLPPRPLRDARAAATFVRDRKIVMETGRSGLPVLSEAIVGHPIAGSWMADPEVHRIHDVMFAVEEPHEFLRARLIQGKRVLLVPELGPAVARIAEDEERVAAARRRLSTVARRLLADAEARGAVQLDEWNAGLREARAARLDLVHELLVASETIHTAEGRHSAIVRPWAQGEISRRFGREGRAMSYAKAQETLLLAAMGSAMLAAEKEVRKWFVFGSAPIDRLVDERKIRRLHEGRTVWLAATS